MGDRQQSSQREGSKGKVRKKKMENTAQVSPEEDYCTLLLQVNKPEIPEAKGEKIYFLKNKEN